MKPGIHNDQEKEILNADFFDQSNKKTSRFYWIIPSIILVLYLLVIIIIIWSQHAQFDIIFSSRPVEHALRFFLAALTIMIFGSLAMIWWLMRKHIRLESQHRTESNFRRTIENTTSTGIRVSDLNGRILYVNPAFCKIIGWEMNELLGTTPPYPYWIEDKKPFYQSLLEMMRNQKTPKNEVELVARRKNGETFIASMYFSPLLSTKSQQPIGWVTSINDITESRRAQQALAASHERFTTVLEGLKDVISVIDDPESESPELLFTNSAYRELFGNHSEGHLTLIHAKEKAGNVIHLKNIDHWFEVQSSRITWVSGETVQLLVARDVTKRVHLEEESRLQQEKAQLTSRLTTMGEMASSLAHELNQPIAAISMYCSTAQLFESKKEVQDPTLIQALEKINAQAKRSALIIQRIREFVKRAEPHPVAVNLGSIINNTLDLAQITANRHKIKIALEVPAETPVVFADPILIEQVLLNLIKNGIESMQDSSERTLHVQLKPLPQNVTVMVIDRGCGLAHPERLFEPFFSTKAEGLGMGLSICRTILESHHSRLKARANPDGGTIFEFSLPYASAEQQAGQDAVPAHDGLGV